MIRAATSYSKEKFSIAAADSCAREALRKLKAPKASFAIVFSSIEHSAHYDIIMSTIKRITGATKVAGTSTSAIITDAGEFEDESMLGLLLVQSDEIDFESFIFENLQENPALAGQMLSEHLKKKDLYPDHLLIFPDHYSFHPNLFFEGFEQNFGHANLIGGTAAQTGNLQQVYQLADSKVSYDAVSGMALSGNIQCKTIISPSCHPFGEPLQVTKSKEGSILEIEGRPAKDIFLEHVSKIQDINPHQANHHVLLGLPFKSFQTDFEKDNYMIRNILEINDNDGSIACSAYLEEGDFLTFTLRDAIKSKLDFEVKLADLKTSIPEEPAFAIYVNCCARGLSLYKEQHEDVQMIQNFFPDLPLLGFFAYGEIAPVDYVNQMHYHSGVLSVFYQDH
jgi:small ligand-binding sensory domain FIST